MESDTNGKQVKIFSGLHFYMRPCRGRTYISKLIEANGGALSKIEGKNFLTLSHSYDAEGGYHTDLIHDSITAKKLQDLSQYRLPRYETKVVRKHPTSISHSLTKDITNGINNINLNNFHNRKVRSTKIRDCSIDIKDVTELDHNYSTSNCPTNISSSRDQAKLADSTIGITSAVKNIDLSNFHTHKDQGDDTYSAFQVRRDGCIDGFELDCNNNYGETVSRRCKPSLNNIQKEYVGKYPISKNRHVKPIAGKSICKEPVMYNNIYDIYSLHPSSKNVKRRLKGYKGYKNTRKNVLKEHYTLEEDMAIMKYVDDFGSERGGMNTEGKMLWGIHGNILWENMERSINTDHTWKSMKERYFKLVSLLKHDGNIKLQHESVKEKGDTQLENDGNVTWYYGDIENEQSGVLHDDENYIRLPIIENVTQEINETNLHSYINVLLQKDGWDAFKSGEESVSYILLPKDGTDALKNGEESLNNILQKGGGDELKKDEESVKEVSEDGTDALKNGEERGVNGILQDAQSTLLCNRSIKLPNKKENILVNGKHITHKNITLPSEENVISEIVGDMLQNVTFQNDMNISENNQNIESDEDITLHSGDGCLSQNVGLLKSSENNTSYTTINRKQNNGDDKHAFPDENVYQNRGGEIFSDEGSTANTSVSEVPCSEDENDAPYFYTPQRTLQAANNSMGIVFSSQNSLVFTDSSASCSCYKKSDYSKALSIMRHIESIPEDDTCWKNLSERLIISDIAFKYGISIDYAGQILQKYKV